MEDMKSALNEAHDKAHSVYLLLVKIWNIYIWHDIAELYYVATLASLQNIRKFEEPQNAESSEDRNHLEVRNALMRVQSLNYIDPSLLRNNWKKSIVAGLAGTYLLQWQKQKWEDNEYMRALARFATVSSHSLVAENCWINTKSLEDAY